MFKKAIAALVVAVTTSTVVFANGYPYTGIDLAYKKGRFKFSDTTGSTQTFFSDGGWGDIFFGFGGIVSPNIYLALEGFAGESSARTSTKNINTASGPSAAKISERYSYGASFIPGFAFNGSVLMYGRLGYIRTAYDLHQTVVPITSTSNLDRQSVTGGQVGLGLQVAVSPCISLRGEYDYSAYRTFRSFGNQITPKDNQLRLGMVYTFI